MRALLAAYKEGVYDALLHFQMCDFAQ